MKRLLAYLFIVLGLGITLNVKVEASKLDFSFCKVTDVSIDEFLGESKTNIYAYVQLLGCSEGTTKHNWGTQKREKISTNEYIEFELNRIIKAYKKTRGSDYEITLSESDFLLDYMFDIFNAYKSYGIDPVEIANVASSKEKYYIFKKSLLKNGFKLEKTAIAKAEPSQTQTANANSSIYKFCDNGTISIKCYTAETSLKNFLNEKLSGKNDSDPDGSLAENIIFERELNRVLAEFKVYNLNTNTLFKTISEMSKFDKFKKITNRIKTTQIAKAEPSQMQKVANKDQKHLCVNEFNEKLMIVDKILKDQNNQCKYKFYRQDHSYIYKRLVASATPSALVPSGDCRIDTCGKARGISKEGFNKIIAEGNKETGSNFAKVKIISKNKSKTKKKVEVAKVEESKQEEFKPKKSNQDKDPPVIQIADTITVNDSEYSIEGKVSDKADRIFIEVDGQTIVANKGKFTIKRFSPIDEQIEIVAIDQWGNRSKPKKVNIKIDIKTTETALLIEKLNPTKIKTRANNNKVALIIGIENYEQTPKATFANLDAKYFYEYVNKGFGVPRGNIKLLVDGDANLVQSLGVLSKWLPGKIKSGKTDLIVFFAGHGLASNDGKELYLLPQDSDPDLLERTALSRNELFKNIIDLNPKSVTMFFDTCFSGISRDEKTLLASARPIRIVADEQEEIPENFTVFSASQLDQISSGLKEANHGIFSYYLMKGIEGKADANDDKKITNGELLSYLDENVSVQASSLGRQQNPSLAGDPDKVLISYR